jgi:hypothetical protein
LNSLASLEMRWNRGEFLQVALITTSLHEQCACNQNSCGEHQYHP